MERRFANASSSATRTPESTLHCNQSRVASIGFAQAKIAGRSAAWLAHQTGGLGVGGSNPLAPTINDQAFIPIFSSRALRRVRILCRLGVSPIAVTMTRAFGNFDRTAFSSIGRRPSAIATQRSCPDFVVDNWPPAAFFPQTGERWHSCTFRQCSREQRALLQLSRFERRSVTQAQASRRPRSGEP